MMFATHPRAAAPLSLVLATVLAVTLSAPGSVLAEDFSKGSTAQTFGLQGETKATFSGKVVDVLCELSGDCADNCGGGARHLGILREADGKLIFPAKNAQFEFNGAVPDLLPYCNKNVDVDGLMIGAEDAGTAQVFMVQKIRDAGAAEWSKANTWTAAWKKANPGVAEGEGPWYRRDPRVTKQIEATGYLGLGEEADKKYIEENQ